MSNVTSVSDSTAPDSTASDSDSRLVWDLPTRIFHWLFVATLCAQYITAKADEMVWHFRLGFFMIGLLTFRIIWGFVGPRHARFATFLKGPGTVLRYMKQVHRVKDALHSVGHNPLGALMVVAMLLLVAAQVTTGLFSTDDIAFTGPYYPTVSNALAERITGWHHVIFNFILAAVALHLAAILFYTFVKKHPLVPAMIHGRKPSGLVPAREGIPHSFLARALIVILIAAGVVYLVQREAPPPAAPAEAGSYN
jgi:cytochrome b